MNNSKLERRVFTQPGLFGPVCGLVLTATALGCQASVQANVGVATKAEVLEIHDFDKPLEGPPVKITSGGEFELEQYALLGARHDLSYAGPAEASCQCLAVSLHDQSGHSSFAWEAAAPRLQPATQWVIALSSSDIQCDKAPEGSLGASYQGYQVSGDNVIVLVEPLAEGRPLTNGAVIPKPLGGGAVYIQASGSVYGKPLSGRGRRCKVASQSSKSDRTASR